MRVRIVGVRIVSLRMAMRGVGGMRIGVSALLVARRRPLAGAARTRARERDQPRQNGAEQG